VNLYPNPPRPLTPLYFKSPVGRGNTGKTSPVAAEAVAAEVGRLERGDDAREVLLALERLLCQREPQLHHVGVRVRAALQRGLQQRRLRPGGVPSPVS
jgi:hypothetical protein